MLSAFRPGAFQFGAFQTAHDYTAAAGLRVTSSESPLSVRVNAVGPAPIATSAGQFILTAFVARKAVGVVGAAARAIGATSALRSAAVLVGGVAGESAAARKVLAATVPPFAQVDGLSASAGSVERAHAAPFATTESVAAAGKLKAVPAAALSVRDGFAVAVRNVIGVAAATLATRDASLYKTLNENLNFSVVTAKLGLSGVGKMAKSTAVVLGAIPRVASPGNMRASAAIPTQGAKVAAGAAGHRTSPASATVAGTIDAIAARVNTQREVAVAIIGPRMGASFVNTMLARWTRASIGAVAAESGSAAESAKAATAIHSRPGLSGLGNRVTQASVAIASRNAALSGVGGARRKAAAAAAANASAAGSGKLNARPQAGVSATVNNAAATSKVVSKAASAFNPALAVAGSARRAIRAAVTAGVTGKVLSPGNVRAASAAGIGGVRLGESSATKLDARPVTPIAARAGVAPVTVRVSAVQAVRIVVKQLLAQIAKAFAWDPSNTLRNARMRNRVNENGAPRKRSLSRASARIRSLP